MDKTAKGFCEDAWSNYRKPGRDPVPLPTALPAVYPFNPHSPKIHGVAIAQLQIESPPPGWDGVFVAEEK